MSFPHQYRVAPISVSVALGHTAANALKATAGGGGWSTVSSACVTFPLHSLISRVRREDSEYHF